MDVRCEKCQTEYELDESRLKPGGVTVKCTNCGHMFKIRKRANTNVGLAGTGSAPSAAASPEADTRVGKPRPPTKPPAPPVPAAPPPPTPGSSGSSIPSATSDSPSGPMSSGSMNASGDRQWMVRLENGEQKSCKELATLQQWIVAGVVSRESLISRSGKTWKRLGDIGELAQYFVIADEARNVRSAKPTPKPAQPGTMLGLGGKPTTPASDDDLETRSTGNHRARPPTPPPPPPIAASAATPRPASPSQDIRARVTDAPATGPKGQGQKITPPADPGRQTAAWAQQDIKATDSMASIPQGPRAGNLSASPDEKAFGGRVRLQPSDDAAFESGRVRGKPAPPDDDEENLYPQRRGSKVGMWIALVSLLVIGAAAGAVYMLVFQKKSAQVAQPQTPSDAAVPTSDAGSAAVVVTPLDGGVVAPVDPLEGARGDLVAGVTVRMKSALEGLTGKDDPASLAMRARLSTGIAQSMQDRALFIDKAEGDKLRKSAKQIVVDSAPLAQRAFNGQQDSASANLAMAEILRLQAKPAPSVKRYIETARSKAAGDKELLASVAVADALLAIRDGKLADASKALEGLDAPDDMRVKLALAQIAYAQSKPADAKALVDQILATQPDHDVALALYKKLETTVASTDPLPPEENTGSATTPTNTGGNTTTNPPVNTGGGGGGDSYDSLLAKANKLAESNCSKALELFGKALEQKPNGVEALTGMGYCHLDAKQFSSAFSKFRAALAVSGRYEPALGGIAETYQRQGNKDAAIEAWKAYLEVYPSSPKAKKQLEILGVTDGGDKPAGGGDTKPPAGGSDTKPADPKPAGSDTPTPTPTPAPAPAPAPAEGSASN